MSEKIKRILVIRFRQLGDSILTTAMCSSLKKSFPQAEIHLVLNERIAAIFDGHPDIDRTITFSNEENGSLPLYIKKVWHTMRSGHYDVIIDMRSTVRTLLFSLFSLSTPIRIGRKKSYAGLLLNRQADTHCPGKSMIEINRRFTEALGDIKSIIHTNEFRLYITNEERQCFADYMQNRGIDFSRPIILAGITTKLAHKNWDREYMKDVINRILDRYPKVQIIFNFAPGREEDEAKRMYSEIGSPEAVKIDIEARSLRELMALCSNCNFYFGNEGGTRHMVQALGIPSFAIFSPSASKTKWMPANDTPAYGIEPWDIIPAEELKKLNDKELFDAITPDIVCEKLFPLLDRIL